MAVTSAVDPAEEIEDLRARLAEAEETLNALRSGEADAVVVDGPHGLQVYTLRTAVEPYRMLVEQMGQGALTVSRDGLILFCNDCFAQLLDRPRERLAGMRLQDFAAPGTERSVVELLERGRDPGRDIALRNSGGDTVDVYVTSVPIEIGGEEVRCLVTTDLSQQELRLRHAVVVEASRDAIYSLDQHLVIRTWNRGGAELTGFSAAEAVGRSEWDLCPPECRAELEDLVEQVRREGTAVSIDTVRRRKDGSRVDLIYTLTPLKGRDGHVTGYSVVAHDITERKEAERRLRFLTEEIDHRGKNLLATVQAIASLSARDASTLDNFLNAFIGRIHALASTHTLLSTHSWRGVTVREIAGAALAGFDGDGRIRIEGCGAVLRPKFAQDLALSLHELATNAAKYGALSVPDGRLDLEWRLDGGRLVVEWRERDGPPVMPPTKKGLGTKVIERTAGAAGHVDYVFHAEGVRCHFEFDADCCVPERGNRPTSSGSTTSGTPR
jgi:PAS domain S-box-containing protein